jgi:hypothetical protein
VNENNPQGRQRFFGRDQTREFLSDKLNSLGVQATLAERGRDEEWIKNIKWYTFRFSLGVIDIPDGPIRWINIMKAGGSGVGNQQKCPTFAGCQQAWPSWTWRPPQ